MQSVRGADACRLVLHTKATRHTLIQCTALHIQQGHAQRPNDSKDMEIQGAKRRFLTDAFTFRRWDSPYRSHCCIALRTALTPARIVTPAPIAMQRGTTAAPTPGRVRRHRRAMPLFGRGALAVVFMLLIVLSSLLVQPAEGDASANGAVQRAHHGHRTPRLIAVAHSFTAQASICSIHLARSSLQYAQRRCVEASGHAHCAPRPRGPQSRSVPLAHQPLHSRCVFNSQALLYRQVCTNRSSRGQLCVTA